MIGTDVTMTKTKHLLYAFLAIIFATLMAACRGVDHSDPRAVAEKAVSSWHAKDLETLKTLINPSNESALRDMDKWIELSQEYKKEHPDEKVEEVPFTYKETVDALTYGEFTEASTSAKVKFDTEKFPTSVILEKVDGKWYFERFK